VGSLVPLQRAWPGTTANKMHLKNPVHVLEGLKLRPSQPGVVGTSCPSTTPLPTTSLSMVAETLWRAL